MTQKHVIMSHLDVTIQFKEQSYTFREGEGTVQACIEMVGIPSGGLQYPIEVELDFTEITAGLLCKMCMIFSLDSCQGSKRQSWCFYPLQMKV